MTKGKPGGKASNYFVCHWRGDLSLGVSFWVNCLLFNVAFSVAFSVLVQIGVIFNPLSVAPITAFIFLLFVGLSCWQIVGTWRCSQKYTNRGGTRAFALLAKIMMVVWVGASLRSVATDWVPLAKAFQRAIAFNKALPTCNVRVLPGGKAVEITGGLSIGSADKLEAALNATPQATVVHVNSIGGLMSEGQKAWHLVRQRGLSTYTDGCASAATLIFLSGKERTIGEGAKIGFHAGAGFGFWDGENNFYNNMAREIMTASGVSEDFINRALATPNSEIWNPSVEEMRRAKVITKEYAPLKTFTSSVLALIENPTNSGVFVPEKTGNEEIDQLIRFFTDSIARWKDLFNEMTSNLQKVGELEIYSEQTLMEKTKLQKGVAVQLRRQEIIEGYRSRAKLEVERVNHDLAAMNLSDPDAKSMLKGMSNSFEKGLLQAEELFTFRLKVESDKKRFLEFMAQKFFRYKIDANKIRFEDQADSDEYEALTKTISESTKALDDFQDKMLKSTESTKQQLKEATQ